MTISEAISKQGIEATIKASEIGKERLGDGFKSSTVKRLTKHGFWADVEHEDGSIFKLRVNGDVIKFY